MFLKQLRYMYENRLFRENISVSFREIKNNVCGFHIVFHRFFESVYFSLHLFCEFFASQNVKKRIFCDNKCLC